MKSQPHIPACSDWRWSFPGSPWVLSSEHAAELLAQHINVIVTFLLFSSKQTFVRKCCIFGFSVHLFFKEGCGFPETLLDEGGSVSSQPHLSKLHSCELQPSVATSAECCAGHNVKLLIFSLYSEETFAMRQVSFHIL